MKKYILFFFAALFLSTSLLQAQQAITLENIWAEYKFFARSIPGFNFLKDGKHYTKKEGNQIKQYDFTTGEFVKDIFDASAVKDNKEYNGRLDDYSFSEDESKILIKTETESIYRYSSRGNFYVYDRASGKLTTVSTGGKQRYTTFSPAADKVAFVRDNNLHIKNLVTGEEKPFTRDGKYNQIINGATDWVYEEEFALVRAFEWSPDGRKIAFLRFDESAVPEFTMTLHRDDAYPEYETFKYPKVGEVNSIVSAHIYDIEKDKTLEIASGEGKDIYFPRLKWTQDPNKLCLFRMNRHQNELELLLADAQSGKTSVLLEETNNYYIDITDDLTFLKDGQHFIWTSEKSGYNHIYLYGMDGREKVQLTKGKYDVTSFYGVDEANGLVYYQAAESSPLRREVFEVNLKGKKKRQLGKEKGWSSAQFSSTFDYYVLNYSNANTASTYTVFDRQGKEVRVLEDNARTAELQEEYNWQPVEFMTIPGADDVELNAWMIKPPGFQASKEYPVFMYVYGGPGSQTVKDQWGSLNHWWFQMLAQKGYIVVSVDNRGTGGRGQEFKKMTYLQLGKYETIDQVEAAKYLGGLPYVDASRIGIFGWSYGGYMSSLCILKGNDVFKAAIAVAPVTNWKWYDTIYTERYMRTDDENPDGYKDNSPVYFADRLKGSYLLVHGMADDNVHFQNTTEMVNALVNANKQFDTYFYPNRNHGIYGGPTRLHLYTKMTNFLINNL
jgi:dipeptidyl-peptidase-4